MKSIGEKRDEEAIYYLLNNNAPYLSARTYFKAGWDACAKEYDAILEDTKLKIEGDFRDEIKKLKCQLEIAKEALQFYAEFTNEFKPHNTSQDFIVNWGHTAQEGLKVLNNEKI